MIVVMTSCAPVRALSHPASPPHTAPAMHARDKRDNEVQHQRQLPGEPDVAGSHRAENELPLGADVEQAGPKREADREADENQRRRVVQRFRQRTEVVPDVAVTKRVRVEDRALEQRDVRSRHRVPGGGEHVAGRCREVPRGVAGRLIR